MLWLYMSVALLLYSGPKKDKLTGNPNENQISPQQIEAIAENKCLRNANAQAFIDLKDAVMNFGSCMMQNIQSPKKNDDIVNTICTKIHKNGYKCLERLMEKMEPCLDSEEKYLPEFLLNAHNYSFEQECSDGKRNLEEKLSAFEKTKCNPSFEYCIPQINLLKNLPKPDYILTKSDLCSDIQTAKDCTLYEAKLHCKDDSSMTEVITAMFNQFLNLCEDTSMYMLD